MQSPIRARDENQEIDALLCSLHRVVTSLHARVEETRRSSSARASHIVDFSQFEVRAEQIATLRHLNAELRKLTAVVAQHGQAADTLHQEEITSMQAYIDSTCQSRTPKADSANAGMPWKDEARTARVLGRESPRTPARIRPSPPNPIREAMPIPTSLGDAARLTVQRVMLGTQISLDAVIIPIEVQDPRKILAAVSTPELYYIPLWDHFAVRCGAVVFHGNIGKIYPPEGGRRPQRGPVRVKECRHRGRCPSLNGHKGASCTYYHDPEKCSGSRDVRNFVAGSWIYAPAATRFSARYGSRRLGSRETLQGDLQEVSAKDARRHITQTAHDILCAIIQAKYVLGAP